MLILDQNLKFKSIIINLKFKREANTNDFAFRTLLPSVLRAGTDLYPNRTIFNEKLESLYGASLTSNTNKIGRLSIINVQLRLINPKLASDNLFDQGLAFLKEYIYGHQTFKKSDFDIEKRLLIDEVVAKENDKTRYALTRLFDEMCKDELYGKRVSGTKSDIEALSFEQFKKGYKDFLKNDELQVLLSGDFNEVHVEKVKAYFPNISFSNSAVLDLETKTFDAVTEIVETDKISQTKLNIGYRFPVRQGDVNHTAAVLFNAALGGYVHSRLFLNVREKHSLCYYVSSVYDAYKGILFIYSGVDAKRVDLAKKVIDEEVLKLSKVALSEDELNLSKQALINDMKEAEDSQTSRVNTLYIQALLNKNVSLEARIEKILTVTPEEILEVAKLLRKDTVYMLDVER